MLLLCHALIFFLRRPAKGGEQLRNLLLHLRAARAQCTGQIIKSQCPHRFTLKNHYAEDLCEMVALQTIMAYLLLSLCSRSLLMCSRSLLMCSRSLLMCSRSLLMCSRQSWPIYYYLSLYIDMYVHAHTHTHTHHHTHTHTDW